jgi:hypothetical protein
MRARVVNLTDRVESAIVRAYATNRNGAASHWKRSRRQHFATASIAYLCAFAEKRIFLKTRFRVTARDFTFALWR